jgi:hypothetical protein
LVGGLDPFERPAFLVVVVDERPERGGELLDGFEHAAFDGLALDDAEEDLDLVPTGLIGVCGSVGGKRFECLTGVVGGRVAGGYLMAGDADGDSPVAAERPHETADQPSGGGLDSVRDGQRREHDVQVGLDRRFDIHMDRAGGQVRASVSNVT